MKRAFVIWPRVEEDLTEHFAFIARDKVVPARRLLEVARESFELLGDRPWIGLPWNSKRPQFHGVHFYPMPSPYRSYVVLSGQARGDRDTGRIARRTRYGSRLARYFAIDGGLKGDDHEIGGGYGAVGDGVFRLRAGPAGDLKVKAVWMRGGIDGQFHFVTLVPGKE